MTQLHVVPLRRRTVAALTAVSLVRVIAFFWPFFVSPQSVAADHATDAPGSSRSCPLVVGVLLAEISDDGLDAKGVAMLAVLSAVATAVRPSAPVSLGSSRCSWSLLLGGRALGPAFRIRPGQPVHVHLCAALAAGVGPWLPFQMVAAGWFAMFAGLLPQIRVGRRSRC